MNNQSARRDGETCHVVTLGLPLGPSRFRRTATTDGRYFECDRDLGAHDHHVLPLRLARSDHSLLVPARSSWAAHGPRAGESRIRERPSLQEQESFCWSKDPSAGLPVAAAELVGLPRHRPPQIGCAATG